MSTDPRQLVDRWRQTVAEHPRRWCKKCRQRNCWEQAYAREQLITSGEPIAPPAGDRPHEATGGARRTA